MGELQGGQKVRVLLAQALFGHPQALLLDEPTNHLDLDSKEVLLDALVDYGGTLIFVSHDRYFVERLATKIIEIGNGTAVAFPGTYKEFLYHKAHSGQDGRDRQDARDGRDGKAGGARAFQASGKEGASKRDGGQNAATQRSAASPEPRRGESLALPKKHQNHDEKKRVDAEARKKQKAAGARQARIATLEARIAETEAAIREVEQQMSAPGFYEDRAGAQPVIDRHQSLMWQVGDLMHQWEELQGLTDLPTEA
jgi:ATP-binding cassette subfamily F protein 3